MFVSHPIQRKGCTTATLLLAGVLCTGLSGCPAPQSTAPAAPHVDLFDTFTPRTILTGALLPAEATAIRFLPDSRDFIVTGKRGEVVHFRLQDSTAIRLGGFTVPDVAPAPVELGLTGVALDPDFARNRFLYMCYTTGDNRRNRVVRLRWGDDYAEIVRSIRTVIETDRVFPHEAEHGIYDLCFGSDGYLYTAMGDATQPEFAQDPGSLLGKLLRLDPRRGETGGYRIPPDNPYLDVEGTRPEIAALGLRTPFRLLAWKNDIYFADVGQNRYEEINLYPPGKANFGWPFCEGYCETPGFRNPVFTESHADPIYETQDPATSSNSRLSISLGVVYAPAGPDRYDGLLRNRLLFNDVFQGFVRAAAIRPDGTLFDDQHIFHLDFITSMAIGPDGYIYGVTIFESRLFRIERKQGTDK